MSKRNASGRTTNSVFRAIYGSDLAKEWNEFTWPQNPSKVVLVSKPGVVFMGLIDADGREHRGFVLSADEACYLGCRIVENGHISMKLEGLKL